MVDVIWESHDLINEAILELLPDISLVPLQIVPDSQNIDLIVQFPRQMLVRGRRRPTPIQKAFPVLGTLPELQ